jgi:hypothetical protein
VTLSATRTTPSAGSTSAAFPPLHQPFGRLIVTSNWGDRAAVAAGAVEPLSEVAGFPASAATATGACSHIPYVAVSRLFSMGKKLADAKQCAGHS